MSWFVNVGAGVLGALVLACKGFAEAHKAGESFDVKFFLTSLIAPLVTGAVVGYFSPDPKDAFAAGVLGKSLAEVYSAYVKPAA